VIDEILDFPAASPSEAALAHAVAALGEVADDHRNWLADTKADPVHAGHPRRGTCRGPGVRRAAAREPRRRRDEADRPVRGAHVGPKEDRRPRRRLALGAGDRLLRAQDRGARSEHTTRSAVMAVLALAIEEIIAIDNIEPADVFDDSIS
jgi:hypothetical protein